MPLVLEMAKQEANDEASGSQHPLFDWPESRKWTGLLFKWGGGESKGLS